MLKIGDSITIQKKVTEELTYDNGGIQNLFATPSLTALMIEASCALIDQTLEDGIISVNKIANVTHLETSVIGETVTVKVEVVEIDAEKINLKMEAFDEIGKIGEGFNEKHIVNKKGLLESASKREEKLQNLDF